MTILTENNLDASQQMALQNNKCLICKQEIIKDDLIHISNGVKVHFKCYIEIQEKLCVICGKPFKDQEELYFCVEHKEYFHKTNSCLWQHLQKHMPFRKAKYDSKKNRILINEML